MSSSSNNNNNNNNNDNSTTDDPIEKPPNAIDRPSRKYGTFTYDNGDLYVGEYRQDQRDGYGVFLYNCGDAYAGEWKNDKRVGFGMFAQANGLQYEGIWEEDMRCRYGAQSLSQSYRYIGGFATNRRHGCGILFQPNGLLYCGLWDNGEAIHRQLLFQNYCNVTVRHEQTSTLSSDHYQPTGDDSTSTGPSSISYNSKCHRVIMSRSTTSQPQFPANNWETMNHKRLPIRPHCSSAWSTPTVQERDEMYRTLLIPSTTKINHPDDSSRAFKKQFKRVRYLSTAENFTAWTCREVGYFVRMLGFKQFENSFIERGIDGPSLQELLVEADVNFDNLGVDQFPARRVIALAFELLLKLNHRSNQQKESLSYRKNLQRALRNYCLSPRNVVIGEKIGVGGYGEVYKGSLLGTPPNNGRNTPNNASPDGRVWEVRRRLTSERLRSMTTSSSSSSSYEMSSSDNDRDSNDQLEYSHYGGDGDLLVESSRDRYEPALNGRTQFSQETSPAVLKNAQHVAIKTFSSIHTASGRTSTDLAAEQRLYTEFRIIARLRHRNIPKFLGVLMKPVYALVTEYVSSGSLFDIIHRRKAHFSPSQTVHLALGICSGMAYLHGLGIVHCDLKSSNVLITNDGNVKVCDFGLAALTSGTCHNSCRSDSSGCVMLGCVGTHHWTAPEVLRGGGFTKAADTYSFGMIIFEMLFGKIPYESLPPSHIIALVGYGRRDCLWSVQTRPSNLSSTDRDGASTSGVPIDLTEPVKSDVGTELRRILAACLSPIPRNRPTFAVLVQWLSQLHHSDSTSIGSPLENFVL